MPTPKQILKLTEDRTKLIEAIIEQMEREVGKAQSALFKAVATDFVDKLETDEDGKIKNTLANRRKIAQLDLVYKKWTREANLKVVSTLVEGVNKMMDFNGKYYAVMTSQAKMVEILTSTKETIRDWLGFTARGALVENGYLDRLLKDPQIKNKVRDDTFRAVVGQKGFFETKKALGEYIDGNKEKAGALMKYHRNFTYDVFNQVDRLQSKTFADKLKLGYAIYEGGIIAGSRKFCRAHNGKVFTLAEIAEFDPTKTGITVPANYDPFVDLGSWGCRHHLSYIPYIVAKAMRPDLPEEEKP